MDMRFMMDTGFDAGKKLIIPAEYKVSGDNVSYEIISGPVIEILPPDDKSPVNRYVIKWKINHPTVTLESFVEVDKKLPRDQHQAMIFANLREMRKRYIHD